MSIPTQPTSARQGFSFIEVLFSVMILGIGFIMIAGVFPVAAKQVESTSEETIGAQIGPAAVATVAQSLPWSSLPETEGTMTSLRDLSPAAWEAVRGCVIWPTDPRYAFIPLIRFDGPTRAAMITVFVVRNRDGRQFEQRDLNSQNNRPANLEPRGVTVTLTIGDRTKPSTAEIEPSDNAQAAAPGAFLVIGNDRSTGQGNGRCYRLGNQLDEAGLKWELFPGSGITSKDEELVGARAFLVGRPVADSGTPTAAYVGLAQDVAVYSGMVSPRR